MTQHIPVYDGYMLAVLDHVIMTLEWWHHPEAEALDAEQTLAGIHACAQFEQQWIDKGYRVEGQSFLHQAPPGGAL
jgi:hypothetical protein